MAAKVGRREIEVDAAISIPAGINLSKDITLKLWQRRWDLCQHGQTTKFLLPRVSGKKMLPTTRCIGISYIRLLLDDTNLEADRFRDRFTDNPDCECDTALETSYHYLMECPLYDAMRVKMYHSILEAWQASRQTGNLSVTVELLLGSCSDFHLSKELFESIKLALFLYLHETNRKL